VARAAAYADAPGVPWNSPTSAPRWRAETTSFPAAGREIGRVDGHVWAAGSPRRPERLQHPVASLLPLSVPGSARSTTSSSRVAAPRSDRRHHRDRGSREHGLEDAHRARFWWTATATLYGFDTGGRVDECTWARLSETPSAVKPAATPAFGPARSPDVRSDASTFCSRVPLGNSRSSGEVRKTSHVNSGLMAWRVGSPPSSRRPEKRRARSDGNVLLVQAARPGVHGRPCARPPTTSCSLCQPPRLGRAALAQVLTSLSADTRVASRGRGHSHWRRAVLSGALVSRRAGRKHTTYTGRCPTPVSRKHWVVPAAKRFVMRSEANLRRVPHGASSA